MTTLKSRHNLSAVVDDLPGIGLGWYDLEVISADVTLDDSWVPYGQVTLVCALPDDEAVTEAIDPREDHAVIFYITHETDPYIGDEGTGLEQLWGTDYSRGFRLILVGREIDRVAKTMTIRADTHEAKLIGDALVDDEADAYPFTIQDSLREIVDYVLGRQGESLVPFDPVDPGNEADWSLDYYEDSVNLLTNPSFEIGVTPWVTQQCTIARTAAGTAPAGAYVCRITPTGSSSAIDSPAITVTPGATYVMSAWGRAATAIGSGATIADARRVKLYNGVTQLAVSDAVPNTTAWGRVTFEVTIPAGVTSVFLRAIFGHAAGTWDWDAILFAEKTRVLDPYAYFDGNTTDTDVYTYSWSGTSGASTSIRTVVTGASIDYDALTWVPGVSAWDFLVPLVQAAGLRLYCDETGEWHLVNYPGEPAGNITLGEDSNLTDVSDNISRYAEWFDAAVITYRWTVDGEQRTAYDVAQTGSGTPKRVYTETRETPYPGAGAAASMLARMGGRGRVFALSAVSDYTFSPGYVLTAHVPNTPEQIGSVSAVTWSLPARTMRVRSTGLVEVSDTGWVALAAGVSWNASAVGDSWLEETA